ncbi:MAG TPA: NADH-quinone oxidoreductase subunit M [Candidatus Dormibacteraeota bacterium]|nr:NADH-quinone oxidoreductase subunit M [Candidatus Dormibacteraeota bacterium]
MTFLLLGAIVVPLVGVALVYLSSTLLKDKTGYLTSALSIVPLVAILLAGNEARSSSTRVFTESYPWSPIGTFGLRVDNLSLPILLTISLLVALIAIFSVPYMKQKIGDDSGRYGLYYALYLLYSIGMLGTVLATNLIEFYLFFEIMLVPSFFLIAEWGYGERDKISLSYFIWTHIGALVLLVGILVTGFLSGTTDMDSVIGNLAANPSLISSTVRVAVVGAMCFGLFVKIAQFGLHAWLPSAYAEAPTPISALLSSVMTGIGGYAIVRIVMTIYPSAFLTLSPIFAGWALVTMFYGSAMALVQDDIKRLLAYSSMSQMGYILFGLATFTSFGISGSMFQYISNATAKGILFIVAGAIMLQFRGERNMSKMGGLAGKMPITATAAFIGSLTLMGFPTTNGFFSEFLLFQGGFLSATSAFSDYRIIVAVLGIVATALTAGYSLLALRKIFFGPASPSSATIREAPFSITAPLIVLSIVTIVLGIYPTPVISRLIAFGQSIVRSV